MARRQRGERHPETFAFLGFTDYCGWTRDGRFIVKHKTQSQRLTRKLKALRPEAWRLMHAPLAERHRWYSSILRGHYGYFGTPHNWRALNRFLQEVRRIWFNCLRRRSQKNRRMGWDWFEALPACWPLPQPRITHPLDTERGPMRVTSGKSRVRESRLPGSVRAEPNGRATRPRPASVLL
jgi:RNA-directed DNA polymerase